MTNLDETASESALAPTVDPGATTTDFSTDNAIDVNTFHTNAHVMETEPRFVVNIPSDIDSEWIDPDALQHLVERVTWEQPDQRVTLQTTVTNATEGETMSLGTVTLRPDETVVDCTLRVSSFDGV